MGRRRLKRQLIAIRLLPDSYVPLLQNTNQLNNGSIIGTVYISVEGTTCGDLRQSINSNLDAPNDFRFLTSAGWPFDVVHEDKLFITECLTSDVVTIQKQNGRHSRIGIKLLNGHILGFIFLSYEYEISHIRNLITSSLGDEFESNETFEFTENNSWPVRKSQESKLSIWDLVVNNCITIVKKKIKRCLEYEDDKSDKRFKLVKKSSLDMTIKYEELNSHSILISYVHNEASTYARDLKNELLNMGFRNIFLFSFCVLRRGTDQGWDYSSFVEDKFKFDVDDIAAGQDWQDVIALALNNCSIFVPLVTPRYGETRWTNREAKLADDKEKIIIPVSFLDKWPPDQLAIQFVTLQYIPWKSNEEINGGSFSGDTDVVWNQKSVQRVANEIKKLCTQQDISTPDSVSLDSVSVLDHGSKLSTFALNLNEKSRNKLNSSKKDFIVISAHCKQKQFVNKITDMLEKMGYDIWCSMNMCECDEDLFSPIEDTQPMLNSPLLESNGLSSQLFSLDDKSMPVTLDHHSSNSVQWLKKNFKDKVKLAKILILIFSEDYLKSRICKQQLFYCEQRKTAIVLKYGEFEIESMILNLYPEHEMIPSEHYESLKFKIEDKLKFDTEDSYRSNIMLSVSKLRGVVDTDLTVYVIGGTQSYSSSAQAFCLVLGTELAKVKNLSLATEGFLGAGEIVGKNFCEEQDILYKGSPPNVYHIVPTKDSSDYSKKARQSSDGSFEKIPYGRTLYYGMSVSNRDDIVAAAFKLCILIEGGERSACLAEKFLWNECTVIPVLFNNTAIKNKQCLLESIKRAPNKVNESDWQNLNRPNCSPEDCAKSVKRIVCSLLNPNVENTAIVRKSGV